MTSFLDFGFQQGLPGNGPGGITSCWSGENADVTPNPDAKGKAGAANDAKGSTGWGRAFEMQCNVITIG